MDKVEVTLEIDAGLVERARVAAVPLSAVVEEALKAVLTAPPAEDLARVWAEENSKALQDRHERATRDVAFGAYLRIW